MAQSLFTSQTPASGNVSNGNSISLGSYITPAVDGTVTHIRWYFPTGGQPGGEAVKGALFRTSDSAKIGGDVSFASPGTPGGWNQVALASPVAVSAGVQLCATVRSPSLYVATTGGASPWPITNGDLSTPTNAGRFNDSDGDGSVQFPTDSFNNGCYFVDLVFSDDEPPAEGSAAVVLDLAVAATGGRASAGSAALGLGLTLAATGSSPSGGVAALGLGLAVNSSGSVSAEGQAAIGLGLAVATAGARPAGGSSAVGLGLTVASTGAREAAGTSALQLNFSVSASGSNGQSGRPVKPWPGTVVPVSSYPWTPRPVRSFQEVDHP